MYNESESDQIVFFNYLSSEIMELEKNEGRGTHIGILSLLTFSNGDGRIVVGRKYIE